MNQSGGPKALIPLFKLSRVLNQDHGGLRVALYGSIEDKPAILTVERAAFNTDGIEKLPVNLVGLKNLGDNDIYRWYMSSCHPDDAAPSLKLNLIFPCTETHVKKYSKQTVRLVTETPEIYRTRVRPYIEKKREGRLDWVYNIIEGRAEQEDVLYREHGEEGFLLTPDLNWDRRTQTSLHLLALVERRDIWSVRDLKRKHIKWLNHMREKLIESTIRIYPDIEKDQLKLYIHYQPTYYHFHVHVVHVELEAGATQATGKAIGLESIISQLESMSGEGEESGMADISLTYSLGEASDLWKDVFLLLKST